MHIFMHTGRAMKFLKLLIVSRLVTIFMVTFVGCEVTNIKVVFTNEPCKIKDGSEFFPVSGNMRQYKQCGPAGYYWIFPCSPETSFSETQKACVNINGKHGNRTQFNKNDKSGFHHVKIQIKPNSLKKNSIDAKLRRPESTDQPWSSDYYDEEFVDFYETTTTKPLVEPVTGFSTTAPSTISHNNRSSKNLEENFAKSKLNPTVTAMPTPDADIAQPDDSEENEDYYRYHVSTIRRTPASYHNTDNVMIGTTAKSQEVFESQSGHGASAEASHYWQGYNEQRGQYGNNVDQIQQQPNNNAFQPVQTQGQSSRHGTGNQQPSQQSLISKQSPANKPLSAGAQELAKVISDEDLETLSRVFQLLASQAGPGPAPGNVGGPPPGPGGMMPPPGFGQGGPQPPGSPMMPMSGFVPPLPGPNGQQPYNMLPPASVQQQMAQFYMLPPPFIQKPHVTDPPRLWKIEATCVENGTCTHDDMAETYCMHESDPVSYYQCSPGVDFGIWVVRQCPAGLHFNNEGECGKKNSVIGRPPPAANKVQIHPPDMAPEGRGGNGQIQQPAPNLVWGQSQHTVDQFQPEPSLPFIPAPPLRPYPEVPVQTVTPESTYVSTNNNYQETALGEISAGGSPQIPLQPNNMFYVKQPQIWEQTKIHQPAPQMPANQKPFSAAANTLLYPGIQQVSQIIPQQPLPYQPTRQVINPRLPKPVVPRPPGYPPQPIPRQPIEQIYQQPSIEAMPKIQLPPMTQKPYVKPATPAPAAVIIQQPNKEIAIPAMPPLSVVKPGMGDNVLRPFMPKPVQIGEQFIQQPQVPLEFETAIPTIMPQSNINKVITTNPNSAKNQLNFIQQASQIYGGYPRYPEIPQLRSLSETSWQGRAEGGGSPVLSAGGHPYQPPPVPTSSALFQAAQLSASPGQTVIRPKLNQNSQILVGNNQIRNNPLKMLQSRKMTPSLKSDGTLQRDAPLSGSFNYKSQGIQQAADMLFTSLVHQKLKIIQSLAQHLADRRLPANPVGRNTEELSKLSGFGSQNGLFIKNMALSQNFVRPKIYPSYPQQIFNYLPITKNSSVYKANSQISPVKSLPYGLNYFLTQSQPWQTQIGNHSNFNFFSIKSTKDNTALILPKTVQKTQEKDNANFSIPFWPVDEKSNYQPYVGQKCRLSSAKSVKAVKFNAKTFLVCMPNKKYNKDATVGIWVLNSCPDNLIFDRLHQKCV